MHVNILTPKSTAFSSILFLIKPVNMRTIDKYNNISLLASIPKITSVTGINKISCSNLIFTWFRKISRDVFTYAMVYSILITSCESKFQDYKIPRIKSYSKLRISFQISKNMQHYIDMTDSWAYYMRQNLRNFKLDSNLT